MQKFPDSISSFYTLFHSIRDAKNEDLAVFMNFDFLSISYTHVAGIGVVDIGEETEIFGITS